MLLIQNLKKVIDMTRLSQNSTLIKQLEYSFLNQNLGFYNTNTLFRISTEHYRDHIMLFYIFSFL